MSYNRARLTPWNNNHYPYLESTLKIIQYQYNIYECFFTSFRNLSGMGRSFSTGNKK